MTGLVWCIRNFPFCFLNPEFSWVNLPDVVLSFAICGIPYLILLPPSFCWTNRCFFVSNSHYIKPKIFLVKFVRSPCLLVLHHLRFLKSRVPRNDGWLPSGKQMLCYWKLPLIVDFHWFPHSKSWFFMVFCMFTRPGMSFQIKMTIGATLWPRISPPLSSMSFLKLHGYFGISIFDDTKGQYRWCKCKPYEISIQVHICPHPHFYLKKIMIHIDSPWNIPLHPTISIL